MEEPTFSNRPWYIPVNAHEVASPALLIYPDRVEHNIQKMISIAGGKNKLRPHVKTHKMQEIIKLQMKHGIHKFKAATIAEVEMVAMCDAKDILLAIQPVGPNIRRFFQLKQEFRNAKISCIADSEEIILQLADMAGQTGLKTGIWIDINAGMDRTGITAGEDVKRLYKIINSSPFLEVEGLHVYDGHVVEKDLNLRQKICNEAYAPVQLLIEDLKKSGFQSVSVVAGGTPTFPVHAMRPGVECSPGTVLLWDYKSSSSYNDMNFLHAALLLTRVISKPAYNLLCIDLGHKAVASEMPQPRVIIPGIEDYTIISHNEEHMVIRTKEAEKYKTGDVLYGIPWHICPTVDRYDSVTTVYDNIATGQFNVEARKRSITI